MGLPKLPGMEKNLKLQLSPSSAFRAPPAHPAPSQTLVLSVKRLLNEEWDFPTTFVKIIFFHYI